MRTWCPPVWVIVSVLSLLLAGCSGQVDVDDVDEEPTAPSGEKRLEAVEVTGYDPIRLVEGLATNVSLAFEGSFAMYEACPVWCGLPGDAGVASAHRAHDISDLVPMGVLTRVKAVLSHNAQDGPTPVFMGGHSLVVRTPQQTYGSSFSLTGASPATEEVVAEVVRQGPGPVEVVVEYYGPEPDQATFDYRVDVEIQVDPTVIAAGVPVALELGEGAEGLALRSVGDEDSVFSLFTPTGSRLGPYVAGPVAGALPLPEGSVAGTYVLVAHESDDGLRLLAPDDGGNTGVRLMDIRIETGDVVELDDEGSASWSFDVEGVPIRVGFVLTSGQASWVKGATGLVSTQQGRAVIEGPNGTIFDRAVDSAFNCVLCPEPRVFEYPSRAGHEGLIAGTYKAEFRATTGPGGSVQAYWAVAT